MKAIAKFFSSTNFKLFLILLVNIAILFFCIFFGVAYIYYGASLLTAFVSIFFLSNRQEKDRYKVIVFLLLLILPVFGIAYGIALRDKKGTNKIKKEWSDIIYRNRKSVFQKGEIIKNLRHESIEAYKNCSYIVDSVNMPCFNNANIKYYRNGADYFTELIKEIKKATKFIFIENYKIVPGELWNELFNILRLKARDGVAVKIVFDDTICTKYMSKQEYLKMQNHGIETVPFNRMKGFNTGFVNCRNYKRLFIVDGKSAYFGGFNIDDQYIGDEETLVSTKDCGVRITGEAVKSITVMFFEDYQFATKKVINLQEYFIETTETRSKDWILPYSTNPVVVEHENKNIILNMINNAKESISIITSYLVLDDELKNALIVSAKSGIKVRLIFSGEKVKKSIRILSRSYFYDLIKEGIEVYEYRMGKMTSRLIVVDGKSALISTHNLDCSNTYKHFNAGVYIYGDVVKNMTNDIIDIINNSQLVTIKDLQKRKITEKISATWNKFVALFR